MDERVARRLEAVMTPRQAQSWLESANAFLGNTRPIDCLRLGKVDEVLDAIDAYEQGSHA